MSDDDDENVLKTFRCDPDAWARAAEGRDHGEMSQLLRMFVDTLGDGGVAGGNEAVKVELESIRQEKDRVRNEFNQVKSEFENKIAALEQKETRLEEKLSARRSRQGRYEGHLEQLESRLRDGYRVWEEYHGVRDATEPVGKTNKEVIEDLKERNPEIPGHAFQKPRHSTGQRWD